MRIEWYQADRPVGVTSHVPHGAKARYLPSGAFLFLPTPPEEVQPTYKAEDLSLATPYVQHPTVPTVQVESVRARSPHVVSSPAVAERR